MSAVASARRRKNLHTDAAEREKPADGPKVPAAFAKELRTPYPALQEMYRRMVFNVLARNQDDHTRNIAFLMDRRGTWRLAPAYDVVWAYNSQGAWTNRHQMSVNGKRDGFDRSDLLTVAGQYGIKGAPVILDQVAQAVADWPRYADECRVDGSLKKKITATHRLTLARK